MCAHRLILSRQASPSLLPVANHASEVDLARGYTLGLLAQTEGHPAVVAEAIDIDFEFTPVVLLPPPDGLVPSVQHVFLARFKPGAPVQELIDGYFGLTRSIPQMRAFMYGRCGGGAGAGGFEYAFVTTFASFGDRDAYLSHPEHAAFASVIFGHLGEIVVTDLRLR